MLDAAHLAVVSSRVDEDLFRRAAESFTSVLKEPLRLPGVRVVERQLRRSAARLGLVVVYHRIGPRRGNDRYEIDPAISTSDLRRQLELLDRHFRVVRADELVAAVRERVPQERFPVAITFDDDLSSHLEHAAPVLRSLRLPATFFLSGRSLERANPHWWDDLQRAADRGRLEPALLTIDAELLRRVVERRPGALRQAMWAIAELPPRELDVAATQLRALAGNAGDRGLSAADVRALRRAGLAIGFHTFGHYQLTTLDDEALHDALERGRAGLEEVAEMRLTTIAYPHGSADGRVADAARAAGFRVGFTMTPQPLRPDDDPLLIGRIVPTTRSPSAFAVQLVESLRRARSEASSATSARRG